MSDIYYPTNLPSLYESGLRRPSKWSLTRSAWFILGCSLALWSGTIFGLSALMT